MEQFQILNPFNPRLSVAISFLEFHLAHQTVVHTHCWDPARRLGELGDIRAGFELVAGAGRFAFDLCRHAEDPFELGDHFVHGDKFATTEVVRFAIGAYDGSGQRLDAIIDVRIAANVRSIARQWDRLMIQQFVDEDGVTHFGPLPGAVHTEESNNIERHAELGSVHSAELFPGQFRNPIRRTWQYRQRLIAERFLPIHARRTGIDQFFERRRAAKRFEQSMRRREVAAVVVVEVRPTANQAGHRGEVEYGIHIAYRTCRYAFRKIEFAKVEPAMAASEIEIAFLDRPSVVGRKTIDADHVVSIRQETVAQV